MDKVIDDLQKLQIREEEILEELIKINRKWAALVH